MAFHPKDKKREFKEGLNNELRLDSRC